VLNNIQTVRHIADEEYRIPMRYRVAWLWWNVVRFIVRIVVIGYFLGKGFETFLEKRGESLLQRLDIAHRDMILPVAVLLIGLVLDHVAEKALDDWNLPKYKRLLTLIVAHRASRLWAAYNRLRMALAETRRSLDDFDRLRSGSSSVAGGQPSAPS